MFLPESGIFDRASWHGDEFAFTNEQFSGERGTLMNQPESQHSGEALASQPWLNVMGSRVLPGVRQPMAVGFQTNEIERLMLIGEEGKL